MEANAKVVTLDHGKLIVPSIEDMIKFKKLGDDIRPKDLGDIAYLEAMLKSDTKFYQMMKARQRY